jgi:hypothetical protein
MTESGASMVYAGHHFLNSGPKKKFRGSAALKRKINPTRVPIEKKESVRWLENMRQSVELVDDPGRCTHIGDRESGVYELFCSA